MALPNIISRDPYLRSIDHVHDELARIELLVRAQLVCWRHSAACAGPEKDWGMVVISDDEVERCLESPLKAFGRVSERPVEQVRNWWEQAARVRIEIDGLCDNSSTSHLRLVRIAQVFKLSAAEKDALLLCLLADLDERYRRLFGYLQNDASRQSLSVGLITQILGGILPDDGAARDLFSMSSNLLANHLIVVGADATGCDGLPLRSVRIDDRIAAYLLGSDKLDGRLTGIVKTELSPDGSAIHARPETLAYLELLPESVRVSLNEKGKSVRLLLFGPDPRLSAKAARRVVKALNIPLLEFSVPAALRSQVFWELMVDLAYREARMIGAALLFGGSDAVLAAEQDRARWEYLERAASGLNGLTFVEVDSSVCAASAINDAQFWQVDLPIPEYETRRRIWSEHLPAANEMSFTEVERERLAADLANAFQNTASQIEDAIDGAWNLARREKPFVWQIRPSHLFEACRRQAGKRLVTFAQRIEPRRSLSIDDVVLPEPNRRQLLDLSTRIRFHREMLQRTGLEQTMRIGKGLLALFAGASGTGKTMAAEALANGQGVDLYKVDLSAVVSKWVGETEKNLSRVFAEAESSSGWLFFDEGESLFGTRGEIKQAQDRLLNLEVNYMLQRIEEFSGVVILATNLRQNIDDAFLRRIHALVEFPQPDAQLRATIWSKLTPGQEHRDFDDAQLQKFAARFELSGGNIRNIVLDAMFRAYATDEKRLMLRHLVAGLGREYQKLGRPITNAEFGETFYKWVIEDVLNPSPTEGARAN